MRVDICFVDRCSKGEYGTCEVISRNRILIEISRELNKDREEFFVTLLHECLHMWIFILKANGIKISERKEHRWIYAVQAVVIKALDIISKKEKNKK